MAPVTNIFPTTDKKLINALKRVQLGLRVLNPVICIMYGIKEQ